MEMIFLKSKMYIKVQAHVDTDYRAYHTIVYKYTYRFEINVPPPNPNIKVCIHPPVCGCLLSHSNIILFQIIDVFSTLFCFPHNYILKHEIIHNV